MKYRHGNLSWHDGAGFKRTCAAACHVHSLWCPCGRITHVGQLPPRGCVMHVAGPRVGAMPQIRTKRFFMY